jgi:hypothetical protein
MSAKEVAERLRKRRPIEKFESSEGNVWLRGLSGKERADYMGRWHGKVGNDVLDADADVVSIALVEENGAASYASVAEALDAVRDWSIPDVSAAAKIILRLSGLDGDSAEGAEKKS